MVQTFEKYFLKVNIFFTEMVNMFNKIFLNTNNILWKKNESLKHLIS